MNVRQLLSYFHETQTIEVLKDNDEITDLIFYGLSVNCPEELLKCHVTYWILRASALSITIKGD